jgi:hypothetical protein
MKNLFTNISQEEKDRILEMHSAKKNVISEQGIQSPTFPGQPIVTQPRTQPRRQPRTVVGNPVQIPGQTPPNRPVVKPKPKPVTAPQIKKVTEGMTVNLYSDWKQTGYPERHTIVKITDNGGKIEIQLDKDAELSLSSPKLTYECGMDFLDLDSNVMDKGKLMYNKELIKSLENQFCSKNTQGNTVPKADFAMNNQQDDTTTGIA